MRDIYVPVAIGCIAIIVLLTAALTVWHVRDRVRYGRDDQRRT